jgi:hypothetical protein
LFLWWKQLAIWRIIPQIVSGENTLVTSSYSVGYPMYSLYSWLFVYFSSTNSSTKTTKI